MQKSDTENTTSSPPENGAQKSSAKNKLHEESLRAAGLSFLVADTSLIASGIMAGEGKMSTAGIFGLTAGLVGTRYGHPKAERQMEVLEQGLAAHLKKEGYTIPEDVSDKFLTQKGGLFDRVENFLYKHPSEVMNIFYGLIGVQFSRTGLQKHDRQLTFAGTMLMSGALGGILIKEKKRDPNHPPEGPLKQFWSWIQEKPLRLTGTLFNINQVFLGLSALNDRRNHPENKSYRFRLLAVAAFTFGNIMMMITNKTRTGHRKIDMGSMNVLADTSARIIAAQPQEVQDALLHDISGYLATQPNVGMNREQIGTMLNERLAKVPQQDQQFQQPADNWQTRVDTSSGDVPPLSPTPSR